MPAPDVPIKEIHAEQDVILADPAFRRAHVLSRLLRYLVAQTLAGRGDQVSGYEIATQCFDRPESFDPQTDSYPRVQAARLRKLLTQYYRDNSRRGSVVFDLVPGDYRVRFARPHGYEEAGSAGAEGACTAGQDSSRAAQKRTRRAALMAGGACALVVLLAAGLIGTDMMIRSGPDMDANEMVSAVPANANMAANMARPRLLIGSITAIGGGDQGADYAARLTAGLQAAIPSFRRLKVLAKDAPETAADYHLTGDLYPSGEGWRLALTLTDLRGTEEIVWTATRTISAANSRQGVEGAVLWAAATLGQQRGVIHAREARVSSAPAYSGYRCMMLWRDDFDSPDAAKRKAVRTCLEAALASGSRDPAFPAAFAWSLSAREASADPATRNLDGALAAARSAVALDPSDSFAQMSMGHVLFLAGEPGYLAADRRARALNPYDPDIMLYAGLHRVYSGDQGGARLLKKAARYHVQPPIVLPTALVVAAAVAGDDAAVYRNAKRISTDPRGRFPKCFWRAIAAGAIGDDAEAKAQWAQFVSAYPAAAGDFRSTAKGFGLSAEVADQLMRWIDEHIPGPQS